jgi:hypothetical protein
MATINLNLTVPDAQVPRVVAALSKKFGQIDDPLGSGIFRDRTNAELLALLREDVRQTIISAVKRFEQQTAIDTARASVADIDAV